MLLIMCGDPLEPRRPDRAFEAEAAAFDRLGLSHVLIDYDTLVRNADPVETVRREPDQPRRWTGEIFHLRGQPAGMDLDRQSQ